MGLRRYRDLFRVPGVAPLMLAAFVGRLPYGMNILAAILLLRAAGFDYAAVGIVSAASGLSVGAAAPVMGRIIDRVGQTRVLLFAAAFTAVSGTVFVVAVLEGASVTLVTVLAFVAGLCVPPYTRFLVVTGMLTAGLAPLPLAGSMAVFAVLVVVAGLGLAPSTAAAYSLIGDLAPASAVTESYSWQIVGYVAGSALGAWVAGVLVESAGVGAALACAPAAAALGLLFALTGRRALVAQTNDCAQG